LFAAPLRRDETNQYPVISEIALSSRSDKLERLLFQGMELRYLKYFVTAAERQNFTDTQQTAVRVCVREIIRRPT
jgi:hypothetical protein